MVSSQSFAGYEAKINQNFANDDYFKNGVKRNSLFSGNTNLPLQYDNLNKLDVSIGNNNNDFYFKTLLRYVRSGNHKNFSEKVYFKFFSK
jgi:hypothetical protein